MLWSPSLRQIVKISKGPTSSIQNWGYWYPTRGAKLLSKKITTFSNSNTYRCKNVTNSNKTTRIAIKKSKTNTNATASSLARNRCVPSPSNWTFLPRTWDQKTRMMTVTRSNIFGQQNHSDPRMPRCSREDKLKPASKRKAC